MSGRNLFEKLVDKFDSFIIWFYSKWSIVLLILLIFLMGFVTGIAALNTGTPDRQLTQGENTFSQITGLAVFNTMSKEVDSPYDWIKEDQIHVFNDRIVIDLKDAEWATFTDTNSMDPVIDKGANALEIVPASTKQIHAGDIISYKSEYASGTIIHRVTQTGFDEEGWYAKTKGDNNQREDPGKIRFKQIQRIVVAIIY